MKQFLFFLFCLLVSPVCFAQDTTVVDSSAWIAEGAYPYNLPLDHYRWIQHPVLHALTEEEEKMDAVVILDRHVVQYVFRGIEYIQQITVHKITRVSSDKAISTYNRIYIPWRGVKSNPEFHARTISPSGVVKEISPSNIRFVENYESYGPYKIAAIDGLEKGSEVEYWYNVIKPAYLAGTEFIPESVYCRVFNLVLSSEGSANLVSKPYNLDCESMPVRTSGAWVGFKPRQYVIKQIRPITPEKDSPEAAAIPRIEYSGFNSSDSDKVARTLADKYFFSVYQSDYRKCNSLLKSKRLIGKTDSVTARQIESYIKNNFVITEQQADDFTTVRKILKRKVMNEEGAACLFIAFVRAARIKAEIVSTSNRFVRSFDPEFLTLSEMMHTFIHVPSAGLMIDPSDPASRNGYIDYKYICQKGFFVSAEKHFAGRIGNMPCLDCMYGRNDITADVKIDLDNQEISMHYAQSYFGNYASGYQPYYKSLSDDNKKRLTDGVLKNQAEDAQITNLKVSGQNDSDWYVKPFVIEADVKSNSFIEKAGPKYLFKIGNLIGGQSELYQESERRTSIESFYNRRYYRILRFTVPDGYKVSNLDRLNMDISNADSSKAATIRFVSKYQVEGKTITVTAEEYYNQIRFPVNDYEKYRSVINAAADFQKIVLFLEKE